MAGSSGRKFLYCSTSFSRVSSCFCIHENRNHIALYFNIKHVQHRRLTSSGILHHVSWRMVTIYQRTQHNIPEHHFENLKFHMCNTASDQKTQCKHNMLHKTSLHCTALLICLLGASPCLLKLPDNAVPFSSSNKRSDIYYTSLMIWIYKDMLYLIMSHNKEKSMFIHDCHVWKLCSWKLHFMIQQS